MRCSPLPAATALATLAALGHRGAHTHWSDVVLRPASDARGAAWAMLREWARQHPLPPTLTLTLTLTLALTLTLPLTLTLTLALTLALTRSLTLSQTLTLTLTRSL